MCRNYDRGECVEEGCEGRITCHDFMDNRCRKHSINGDHVWLDEDEDEETALARVTEFELLNSPYSGDVI